MCFYSQGFEVQEQCNPQLGLLQAPPTQSHSLLVTEASRSLQENPQNPKDLPIPTTKREENSHGRNNVIGCS